MTVRASGGRSYLLAFLGLVALTTASLGLSALPLGGLSLTVALSIASVKASVVGLVFMHLGRGPIVPRIVAVASIGFVALVCLGIVADVAFR